MEDRMEETEILEEFEERKNEIVPMPGNKYSDISEEEDTLYVKFRKPFHWEDDTYDGIDLSGLENLTARDLEGIEKRFYRTGITSFNPENTMTYAKIVAQAATGMPVEFFDQLPVPDMVGIKRSVVGFFFT